MWDVWSNAFLSAAFFSAAIRLAAPLACASIGEIFAERAGVVNIGLEGMILAGAFTGVLGAHLTGDPWTGLLCGVLGGLALALVHALVSVTLAGDQVVSGIALNVIAVGTTTFLARLIFGVVDRPAVPHFAPLELPILSSLPVLGEALFRQAAPVYIVAALVPAAWFVLARTNWGLRARAVGEHPRAAESLGVSVGRVRYAVMALCGALAGLAGAILSLAEVNMFVEGMSGGRGFIALAVVIVAKWHPVRAAAIALLFGALEAAGLRLQSLDLSIPYQFVLMLPYLLTLLVYAGFIGKTRVPGALGVPYLRD